MELLGPLLGPLGPVELLGVMLGPVELLGLLWGLLGALQGGNVAGGGALQGGAVADRYASSATQTKPFRDRPTAAARSCALALRAGGHRRGNDVVLIFISI